MAVLNLHTLLSPWPFFIYNEVKPSATFSGDGNVSLQNVRFQDSITEWLVQAVGKYHMV